jgi:hypothetical protein
VKLKIDWWDVVLALIVFVVVGVCYGCLASFAQAGGVCRVQKVVAHQQYVAPVLAPVYYQIGQSVQREAVDTLQFRHSEEYQELRDLRVYKQAIETAAIIAQGNSGDRPTGPAGLATKGGDNPAGTEQPPAPPAASILQQTCAKCHSGETPKGDLWLDGTVSLDGPDAATKRDAIVNAIRTGHMPPNLPDGQRLPPEKLDAIEDELYGVQVVADPSTPPEGE